jgi:hypothetical protein
MKTWYIYLLPNVPKVGLTSKLEARIYANSQTLKLDTSNWRVLEVFKGERLEAHAIELKWQKEFNCIDGMRSDEAREKMKKPRAEFSKEHRQHQKEGSARMEKPTCEVCGKTMKLNLFRAWNHGPNCKKKIKHD